MEATRTIWAPGAPKVGAGPSIPLEESKCRSYWHLLDDTGIVAQKKKSAINHQNIQKIYFFFPIIEKYKKNFLKKLFFRKKIFKNFLKNVFVSPSKNSTGKIHFYYRKFG